MFGVMDNIFEISVKGLSQPEPFKMHAQRVAKELSHVIGFNPDIKILVEPISKGRGVFSVSIYVDVNGDSFAVHKKGKRIYSLLKQAKKIVIKVARKQHLKKIKKKRKRFDWQQVRAVS